MWAHDTEYCTSAEAFSNKSLRVRAAVLQELSAHLQWNLGTEWEMLTWLQARDKHLLPITAGWFLSGVRYSGNVDPDDW